MRIPYDHSANVHTLRGPEVAFPVILAHLGNPPASVIDVGCGTGSWLRAAGLNGIPDVFGVDGVSLPEESLAVDRGIIKQVDLTHRLVLDRTFGLAICLEVVEHLNAPHVPVLFDSLVAASDTIVFSAACPGQLGQNHVNCQWPDYWQQEFNRRGFVCNDQVRWALWDLDEVEPWYRQNVFVACRQPELAGLEPRLRRVIHPNMLPFMTGLAARSESALAVRTLRRLLRI